MRRKTSGREPDLLCYKPYYYWVTSHEEDGQYSTCIAPTAHGGRCRWDITEDELHEARFAELQARRLEAGDERMKELERLVLARCCGDQHRQRIENEYLRARDKSQTCLRLVAVRYEREIMSQGGHNAPRTVSPVQPSPSTSRFDFGGNPRRQYNLRPRDSVSGRVIPGQSNPAILQPLFTPYDSSADPSILETIASRIPEDYPKTGYIYAYSWPSNPGFVKIGYSTNTTARITQWQLCNPGATLFINIKVSHPKRVEELVHAQLRDQRRQIIMCSNVACGRKHWEWFEISANTARQTIQNWVDLAKEKGLYSSNGSLSPEWARRIRCLKAEITAKALLDSLHAERNAADYIPTDPCIKTDAQVRAHVRTEFYEQTLQYQSKEADRGITEASAGDYRAAQKRRGSATCLRANNLVYSPPETPPPATNTSKNLTADWDELLSAFTCFMCLHAAEEL